MHDRSLEWEDRHTDVAGLRTPGLFARHPYIGVILFFIGSLIFGYFFYNLATNGPFIFWDKTIAAAGTSYARQHQYLKPYVDFGFFLGSWVQVFIGIPLAIYFIVRKYWEELLMLLYGMGGDLLLFESISNLVGRHRPTQQMWIVLKIPGFPSGHVMASIIFFGFLAYLLIPHIRSSFGKALIIILAVVFNLYIGFDRVFTAAHYLTDVLAGYGLGLAWLAIVFPMVEIYYRDKRSKNGKKRQTPPFTTHI